MTQQGKSASLNCSRGPGIWLSELSISEPDRRTVEEVRAELHRARNLAALDPKSPERVIKQS